MSKPARNVLIALLTLGALVGVILWTRRRRVGAMASGTTFANVAGPPPAGNFDIAPATYRDPDDHPAFVTAIQAEDYVTAGASSF